MTNQDHIARDLAQRAHAEEIRPAFDIEAGVSDVLARAGVDVPQLTAPLATSQAAASGARSSPLALGETSTVERHGSGRCGGPAGNRALAARSASLTATSQPRLQVSPDEPTPTELLDPLEWQTLEQQGRPRSYARGQVLFFEGDPGGSVTALRRGRTKVSVQTPSSGRELLLAVKGPGEFVGEMSALDGRPRSATATAMEAVEALVVPASVFHDFLKAHPRIALRLLQKLASELRDTDELLAARDAGDTVSRTARRLVHLARRYGKYNEGSIHVGLSLTHDELASWIGVSRESASRALSQLRVDGFITTGRRSITVIDLAGLHRRYVEAYSKIPLWSTQKVDDLTVRTAH